MKTGTTYPSLPISYKNMFPFRISTTSFIYPDTYAVNIQMLGPHVDEIELLMFESTPGCMPSRQDISGLCRLCEDTGITCNIHLPYDVSLTDPDPGKRNHAIEVIKSTMELTAPLSPSTWTLHLPCNESGNEPDRIPPWQERGLLSIRQILETGIDSRKISVETLNYPFEWAEPVVRPLNLSVCLDLGHLIRFGFNVNETFLRYRDITSIIHLHGVDNQRQDHVAVTRLNEDEMACISDILYRYNGIVSVEVFTLRNLIPSLKWMENAFTSAGRKVRTDI